MVLFGTHGTSNPLWSGAGGGYEHVTLLHAPERPRVSLTTDLDAVKAKVDCLAPIRVSAPRPLPVPSCAPHPTSLDHALAPR